MRTRRRRKVGLPSQNLDSFLDILTNTVGVLMFITLFVTLIAVESDTVVKTPLASQTKKTPRFFEIKENQVTYINDEKVKQDIELLVGNLPSCNKPDFSLGSSFSASQQYVKSMRNYRSCIVNRGRRLVNFKTQTQYYKVKMIDPNTFALRYDPISTKTGETEKEFLSRKSQFNQTLATFNPQEDYLAFIVRPDSFSSFRSIRQLAWDKGFEVGWEPHKSEIPIIFGSGGRSIGVQ